MPEHTQQPPRTVLVTGASTFLGGYLVARLAANPEIERILAVDSRVPRKDLLRRMGRAEFLRLDIRRPAIAKALASYDVDTVVHAATSIMETAPHSAAIKEFNVVGAMQVCAACQRTPSVKRLVLRSTAMVYGASGRDPSHFAEETPPAGSPHAAMVAIYLTSRVMFAGSGGGARTSTSRSCDCRRCSVRGSTPG